MCLTRAIILIVYVAAFLHKTFPSDYIHTIFVGASFVHVNIIVKSIGALEALTLEVRVD